MRHQAAEARALAVEAVELRRVLGHRLPDAADRVGEDAQLLEDAVVRDGAELRGVLEVGRGLPASPCRFSEREPVGIEQVDAVGAQQRRVAGVVDHGDVEGAATAAKNSST